MRYGETCLGRALVLTGELLGEDLVLPCTGAILAASTRLCGQLLADLRPQR